MGGQRSLPGRLVRPTILVVDDDAGLRESFDLILGDAYRVVPAADGRAAMASLESERVDAVLLDILLPGDDGLEVLREIRAADPQVPLVMVTGVRTVVTAVESMRLGAFDYVTKPFEDDMLLDVVSRALAHGDRRRSAPAAAEGRIACLVLGGSPGWRAALRLVLHRRGIDVVTDDAGGDGRAAHLDRVRAVVLGPGREAAPVAEDVRRRKAAGSAIVAMTGRGDILHGSCGPPGSLSDPPGPVAAPGTADAAGHVGRVVARVEHSIGRGASTAPISRHVSRGVEYFANHYAEGMTLTSVAGTLGISESHFAHTFQSEIGLAPKLFLTRLRLDVAAGLLADGGKMGDVARLVGLFDGSHLSRLLRQHSARWRPAAGRRSGSAMAGGRPSGDPADGPS